MTGLLVFSDDLTKYDFGTDHPMAPGRVTNTISLARQLGVLDRLRIVPPPEIDLALLQTVHTPDYIAAVQRGAPNQRYGLGTSDEPGLSRMQEIAAWVTMARRSGSQGLDWRCSALQSAWPASHAASDYQRLLRNEVAAASAAVGQRLQAVSVTSTWIHHGDRRARRSSSTMSRGVESARTRCRHTSCSRARSFPNEIAV
jgi:acetoin utilization protein AcuC